MTSINQLGFLRIWNIVGDKKRGIPPLLPMSRATWWAGVKSGRYPRPIKISGRITAWRTADIADLIDGMGAKNESQK